jgi:hypothetical protein
MTWLPALIGHTDSPELQRVAGYLESAIRNEFVGRAFSLTETVAEAKADTVVTPVRIQSWMLRNGIDWRIVCKESSEFYLCRGEFSYRVRVM